MTPLCKWPIAITLVEHRNIKKGIFQKTLSMKNLELEIWSEKRMKQKIKHLNRGQITFPAAKVLPE